MKARMVAMSLLVGALLVLVLPGAQPAARRLGRAGLTVAARSGPQLGGVNTWTMQGGPFSANSIALSPDFPKDGRMFVANYWYRVFYSSDSGGSWKLAGELSNYGEVIRISPSFAADSTLFVASSANGSHDGAVHKSTDGGHTWTVKLYKGYVEDIEISPNYGSDGTIFAASRSAGLFKSCDGGESWVKVYGDPVWDVELSPAYAVDQTIFARPGNVIKSTDGGLTWISASQGLLHEPVFLAASPDFAVDRTVFAAATDSPVGSTLTVWVYKSTDGGQNWLLAGTLSGREGPYALAISPDYAADHTLFLSAEEIYASHDSGVSWEQKTHLGLAEVESAREIQISPGYASDGTVFANLAGGLYRSSDRGTSWHIVVPGDDVVSAAYAPAAYVYAAVGGTWSGLTATGGVFRSEDNGTTWSVAGRDVVAGATSLAISPAYESDGTLFAGHYQASVSRSSDMGTSWTTAQLEQQGRTASLAVSPDYSVDKTVFAGLAYGGDGDEGNIYRSTDGGGTWASVSSSLPQIGAVWALGISPSFGHDSSIFAATDAGVFRSVDGGDSWASSGVTSSVRSLAVSPNYATDGILLAGNPNRILKSVDRGQTWYAVLEDNLAPPVAGTWYSIVFSPDFASDGVVFAGRHSLPRTIWSQSGGECWDTLGGTSVNWMAEVATLTVSAPSGPTILAGGPRGGFYEMTLDIDSIQPVGNLSTSWDVSPSALPADGAAGAVITVTLRDSSCSPVPGKWVTFSSDRLNTDTITYLLNPTDGEGRATALISSSTTGTATVRGRLGYAHSLNGEALVTFGEPERRISGVVSDGYAHPLPGVFVGLLLDGIGSYAMTCYTENDGSYAFSDVPVADSYMVSVILRDASSRTSVHWGTNGLLVGVQTPPFSFSPGQTSLVRHVFFIDSTLESDPIPLEDLDDLALMFYRSQQVNDFVRNTLGQSSFQPVDSVWGFSATDGVFYDLGKDEVNIDLNSSQWDYPGGPMNREWHENFHHVLADALAWPAYHPCQSGSCPDPSDPPCSDWPCVNGDCNHGGWHNHCTVDSWVEGWAEFWPCVLADSLGQQDPHLYRMGGIEDFERNWTVWEYEGCLTREEFAVASLLWDLYDPVNPPDSDYVDLTATQMWNIMGNKSSNDLSDIKDVYDAFGAAGIGSGDSDDDGFSDLDEVFIAHGFFADTNDNQAYDDGEELGRAADASRPDRRNTPEVPNAYILVNVRDADGNPVERSTLVVDVTYEPPNDIYDYAYEVTLAQGEGNMIPFTLPPVDAPSSGQIAIRFCGHTTEAQTVDNAAYWAEVAASTTGYAQEFTFSVGYCSWVPLVLKSY